VESSFKQNHVTARRGTLLRRDDEGLFIRLLQRLACSGRERHRAFFQKLKDLTAISILSTARAHLVKFVNDNASYFNNVPANPGEQFQRVCYCLTVLRSLQSELDYLLADAEIIARSLVERAFLHLQRAIVADKGVRETWLNAYNEGETTCEKLGATHLLLHGIWAFKASAAGERTDLVLGEKLQITPEIESASEALVLTEWKLVRTAAELNPKSAQAFEQAKLYSTGSLAGFELASRRYLIMVSKGRLEMPADRVQGDVLYQYRNVAIEAATPSSQAKGDGTYE
jgi:hypothetical protein